MSLKTIGVSGYFPGQGTHRHIFNAQYAAAYAESKPPLTIPFNAMVQKGQQDLPQFDL